MSFAQAQVDPSIHWKTIETDHFTVVYDANHRDVAEVYAEEAELAYTKLLPLFNNEAPPKTVIVLDDSTDLANGSATPIPRPIVYVYPVLPETGDFLSHYTSWAREMITHEYTHILNMEPSNGFLSPLRFLFGSIVRPNGLLPRWYLEGLAVHNETLFTEHGRLRSPLYKAMIRAAVLDGTWGKENLARAGELTIPDWPQGTRPYFYGALLWKELVDQTDLSTIGKLNDRYSRRVPFFINQPVQDLTKDKDFVQLLKDMYSRTSIHANAQLDVLKHAPTTDSDLAWKDLNGYYQYGVEISPDQNKMIFISRDTENKDQVYMVTRNSSQSFKNSKPQRILSGLDSINRLSWLSDSSGFVYDAASEYNRYNLYSDLLLYKLEPKKIYPLTKGLRAKDAALSSNGKKIVFVVNKTSSTELKIADIDGENLKNIRTLYSPPLQVRVSNPNFKKDGRVLFLERNLNGQEFLWDLDITSKIKTKKLVELEPIVELRQSQNQWILISQKTKVQNAYIADAELKSAQPLTNTYTHIFSAARDNTTQTLWASRLTSTGAQIEESKVVKTQAPILPESTEATWKSQPPQAAPKLKTEEKDYSSVDYLWPQFWLPVPFFSSNYGLTLNAVTYGADPLNKHRYLAIGTYDFVTAAPGYQLSYVNSQTPATISLSALDQTQHVEAFDLDNREINLSGSASFHLPGLSSDYRGYLGWSYYANQYEHRAYSTQQGPSIGLNYSNSSQSGYEISPRSGLDVGVSHTQYLKGFGNIYYPRTGANVATYWSRWLPKYHAIKLSAEGTHSPKDRSLLRGTTTAGGEYMSTYVGGSAYTVRGYPVGEFVGWSLATTSVEYRFPIWYIYNGSGTMPVFARRLHGAVFWDTVTTEGAYYDSDLKALKRTKLGSFFSGYGLETRWDFTIFHQVPFTLKLGYHYGASSKAYGGGSLFLGFVLPEI